MPEADCLEQKNTGQVIWKPAREKVPEVLVRKNFPPTGQKIIACGQCVCPKEKPGKPFYGLLGLNTDYEPPAGQLFFSAVTFCGRCAILPQTKRQKFQEEKTKLLYKIQINPNKKIDSIVNLFMVQLSL